MITFISFFAHVMCSSLCMVALAFSPTKPRVLPLSSHHRYCASKTDGLQINSDGLILDDSNDDISSYYNYLLSQFQGDFDNYNQVIQDRRHYLLPAEGGGHEHIHCTLVPCPQPQHTSEPSKNQWVLAAFYFNGNPRQIFRFRLYQLIPPSPDDEMLPVRMKLNTLLPQLEQQLRQCSDQPCIWWKEVWQLWCKENEMLHVTNMIDSIEWSEFQSVGLSSMSAPLEGCDVLWEPDWDPVKHSYLYANEYEGNMAQTALPSGQSCHATMEAGDKGAIVDSISLLPGKRILIKDELSLWQDEFWINDRGYDPDAPLEGDNADGNESDYKSQQDEGMPFVYGNRRGVPYKLQRVSSFCSESMLDLDRVIANLDLEWTLGENYRTEDVLNAKLKDIDDALK